jgi:hypothetical protein
MESRLMTEEEVGKIDWNKYSFKLVINTNELSGDVAGTPQTMTQTLDLKATDMTQPDNLYRVASKLLRDNPTLIPSDGLPSELELWFGLCGGCGCRPNGLCQVVCAGGSGAQTCVCVIC